MAIDLAWLKSVLFVSICYLSSLIEAAPRGVGVWGRATNTEQTYDYAQGGVKGGDALFIFGVILLTLMSLLFCYCCYKYKPHIFEFCFVRKCVRKERTVCHGGGGGDCG